MTTVSALEPEQALALLAALQPQLHGAAVLSADGTLLAGDPELDASAVTARSARHEVRAAPGRTVLRGVLAIDLNTVLEAVDAAA